MTEIPSEQDMPRLYTLHSQKGGVGKTSIAIAIAGLECVEEGARTLFLDADLTGTCVADALGMPWTDDPRRTWLNDILLASPDEFLELTHPGRRGMRESTRQKWRELVLPIRVGESSEVTIDVIPSNPDMYEVRRIIPSLAQECNLHYYADRLQALVLAAGDIGYDVVVVDLPPGMFGLSAAAFRVSVNLPREHRRAARLPESLPFAGHAIAVTTTDPSDYRAVFPTVMQLEDEAYEERRRLPADLSVPGGEGETAPPNGGEAPRGETLPLCQIWFNKAGGDDPAILVGERFKYLEEMFESPTMEERVHNPGGLPLWSERLRERRRLTAKAGANVLRYVEDFNMTEILLTVSNLHATGALGRADRARGGFEGWIQGVWAFLGQLRNPEGSH